MADEFELDQDEQVKQWLKQNVPWIVAGIVLGMGGLFGYRYWQDSQAEKMSAASDIYQSLVDKVQASGIDADINDELNTLTTDFSGTSYNLFAQLMLAKQQVSQDDLTAAADTLQSVLPTAEDAGFGDMVRTRIARVQLAQENADAAINTLSSNETTAFEGISQELRGDAHVLLGNIDQAREAYQQAIADSRQVNPLLIQKLNALSNDNTETTVSAAAADNEGASVSGVTPEGETVSAE